MASSSTGGNEPPSTRDDASENEQNELSLVQSYRSQLMQEPPAKLEIKPCLGENKEAYVELSGDIPFVSHEHHHRVSLSNFRRAIGYSDQQYDDATAVYQSTLRANPSHDPAQSVNVDDPRARLEVRMTPVKPKCFHLVPHLLSLEIALRCKGEYSIEKTFDLDHPCGFTVYKVVSTGNWNLLHALVSALTFRHPSTEFSALDLYYYYQKAVKDEPSNRVSTIGFSSPTDPMADNCTFDWDITAQALDSYMEDLGFGPYTFVLVRPPAHKKTPVSCVFTIPCALKDEAVAQMQRVWIVYTTNEHQARPQFNVVVKYNSKLPPRLVNAVNELGSQQDFGYIHKIRLLETDLMNRKVTMTSLTLEEIQQLFHETEAARHEHMSRPGFGPNATKPSRLSQKPNHRKRELELSTPSPLMRFDPEFGHSRRKYRSSSPMSHVSLDFTLDLEHNRFENGSDTGSMFGTPRYDSDEATGTVTGDKDREEAIDLTSLMSSKRLIMEEGHEEDSDEEDTSPLGPKRVRVHRNHDDDASGSTSSVSRDHQPTKLRRPPQKPFASAAAQRLHTERVARSQFNALYGFEWPTDRKKK